MNELTCHPPPHCPGPRQPQVRPAKGFTALTLREPSSSLRALSRRRTAEPYNEGGPFVLAGNLTILAARHNTRSVAYWEEARVELPCFCFLNALVLSRQPTRPPPNVGCLDARSPTPYYSDRQILDWLARGAAGAVPC